jgi:drug/metabolite transporter (DMT)-like permease
MWPACNMQALQNRDEVNMTHIGRAEQDISREATTNAQACNMQALPNREEGTGRRLAGLGGLTAGRYVDLLWLLTLGTLWGSSFLFIKVIVAEVPAFTLVAGRLAIATATMWIVLRLRGFSMPRDRRTWGAFALMGLFNGALPYSLISWGEQHTSSGMASLLMATTPLFTLVLGHLFTQDERITPLKAVGVAVGFAGIGLLMVPDLRRGVRAGLLGQLAITVSSLSYATATLLARRLLRGQPAMAVTTGQLTTGLLFTLPFSLFVDRPFDLSPSLPALASWVGLALLGTVAAYLIYFPLLNRTGATFSSMVTYIVPVNGLLLGALVLHEPLQATVLASLVLVAAGVALVRS